MMKIINEEDKLVIEDTKSLKRKTFKLKIDFDVDYNFFAILPALNINLHSKEIEFEWFYFGLYIGITQD
jgi:hypothetical protein